MAPTGRAAKVMGSYAKKNAFTIHRFIYSSSRRPGKLAFQRKRNTAKHTLFIVDESSMIASYSHGPLAEQRSLLQDLLEFVAEGEHCRLLFVGDRAQLPPVHQDESPALSKAYLEGSLGFRMHVLYPYRCCTAGLG